MLMEFKSFIFVRLVAAEYSFLFNVEEPEKRNQEMKKKENFLCNLKQEMQKGIKRVSC